MNTTKVRVGLVGAGAIAQTYVQAFAQSAAAELVGVADVQLPAATALAGQAGCRAFGSCEQLIDAMHCEAAVICTPPATHPDICCRLLEGGVHVLCEKPLAISVSEARRMAAAAQHSGRVLTMASKFRYVRDVIEAKSIVASGRIGDVILFENAFTSRVDMEGRWNSDPAISGGGVLIDNGTHSVDIMRYFLGPLVELQAVAGRRVQDLPVEDTARVFVRSAAGVMGTIDLSWSISKESPHYLSIYGSAGTLHVGWRESTFRGSGDQAWTVFGQGYDKRQAFTAQLDNFARSLQGQEPCRITLEDALASVEVIEAAYQALHGERWVPVIASVSHSLPVTVGSRAKQPERRRALV